LKDIEQKSVETSAIINTVTLGCVNKYSPDIRYSDGNNSDFAVLQCAVMFPLLYSR